MKREKMLVFSLAMMLVIGSVAFVAVGIDFSSETDLKEEGFIRGGGTRDDPVMIYDVDGLQNMNLNLSGNYALASDIYASETAGWNDGAGFAPVGNGTSPFTGSLDGRNHRIEGIHINRPGTTEVGLFGRIGSDASVSQVSLVDCKVNGADFTGILVGYMESSTRVSRCASSGAVSGAMGTGGLVGYAEADTIVQYSSSSATVNSGPYGGGLVGYSNGLIRYSFAVGDVNTGPSNCAGGLVGYGNGATISNCYATGDVDGHSSVGGIVGYKVGFVDHSYSSGRVTASGHNSGGFTGHSSGSETSCFWDIDTSGHSTSAGDEVGLTTTDMMTKSTFTDAGWNFNDIWHIQDGLSYPMFQWQELPFEGNGTAGNPYLITNVYELQAMSGNLSAHYAVANDIDALATRTWNTPAAHWRMDEEFWDGTAGEVRDSYSNHHGTAVGGADTVEGKIWRAGSFDGNGQYVEIPDHDSLDLVGQFTVTAWINVEQFVRLGGIVSKYHTPSANGFTLRLGRHGNYNKIDFCGEFESNQDLVAGIWYHVAATYDQGSVSIYINGSLDVSGDSAYTATANDNPVRIGSCYNRHFNGDIDEVRLYDRVLTSDEILQAMTDTDIQGFEPVGTEDHRFTGSLDGKNHTISNLFINRVETDYVGLFGYVDGAKIKDLGLRDVDITGANFTGSLFGRGSGVFSEIYSTGEVSGGNNVGGLIGFYNGSSSTLTDSYSTVNTMGSQAVGGLVGRIHHADVIVENSYSTGMVNRGNPDDYVGGLVGLKHADAQVIDSYWDTKTSGQSVSDGGEGKTTAEMKTQSTFIDAGWDFDDIWHMREILTYPKFQWQSLPEGDFFVVRLFAYPESNGWNYVSFNVDADDTTLLAILENDDYGISGRYDSLMYYDASGDEWLSYVPGRPDHFNNLQTWDHTMGIWIKMNSDATLVVFGEAPVSTDITLQPGWNMVGLPSNSAGNHGLPEEVTRICYFNASQEYNMAYDYDPENFVFEPGQGYWIHNPTEGNLIWTVDY